MKKGKLYILIALMGVSLIGIIWVQIYWIHNGVQVKEAQFDQLVNDALNHVVTDIEDNESFHFIHKQLASTTNNIKVETDSIKREVKKIKTWKNKISIDDSNKINNSFNYSFSDEGDGNEMEMKISVNGETKTIDISNKLEKLKDLGELLDDDSFIVNHGENFEFSDRFGEIIMKMVKEFKDIDKPIHHLLESIDLDSIVRTNLEDNGITLPYTYGVLHGEELMSQFSSEDFTTSKNTYGVSLFKHNILDKSAQLAITFKGKRHYIMQSMGLMVICSILFTLIILLTFASTLHHMFKQKKLSEMKNDFINNMTHELKTPISTISLAVDSITHPKVIDDKSQINHFADIIRKENTRMNRQIESVLNTALGEKGELEFNKNQLDVNETLQKIQERMKLQLEANKAILNLNLCKEKLNILGDEMHLQNAICNLIDNALKYNENKPEITITTNLVNEFCELSVSDNGIGMSKETQKKVFDKFYRVEKGNIHTVKGFGIGLSYVKTIVDAHKGLISLKSKPNEGTIITINIPAIT